MNSKDIQRLTKQAIIDYNIDVPIMATRIIGNKLELYLYGGQVIRIPIQGEDVGADRDPPNPSGPNNTTVPPSTGKNKRSLKR